MSIEDLKKIESKEKKLELSNEESEIRDQIEAYHVRQQELSKEIEEKKAKKENISDLEITFNENKEEYERLSKLLDKFE